MKIVIRLISAGVFVVASLAGAVPAQQPMQMPMPKPVASARATAAELTDGEVRKLDKAGRKIVLKHGEIKNLGMAPMAMEFEVKKRVSMDKLKVGDKVRFRAVFVSGKYVVTELRPAR